MFHDIFFNVQFSRHSWVCRVRRGFQDTPPLMDPSPVPDIEICRHFYLNVPKDLAFRGKSGPLWFDFFLTRATEDQQETE